MVSFTLAAVVGLLATASALPPTPPSIVQQHASTTDIEAIMAVPQDSFTSYKVGKLVREGNATSVFDGNATTEPEAKLNKRCEYGTNYWGNCCVSSSGMQLDWGDTDNGGWGITVENGDTGNWRGFYFYEYGCPYYPYKYTWVGPGSTVFITLPWNYNGHMTRGIDSQNLVGQPIIPATWFEFNWHTDANSAYTGLWADVSLIRGCDGGMLIWSQDGTGAWKGFTQDLDAGAPSNVGWVEKPDGAWVLSPTEDGGVDVATDAYELSAVGAGNAYIDDSHGSPTIFSTNGRMGVYITTGYP